MKNPTEEEVKEHAEKLYNYIEDCIYTSNAHFADKDAELKIGELIYFMMQEANPNLELFSEKTFSYYKELCKDTKTI